MSKALLQQQAAKVLKDIADHQQKMHADQQAQQVINAQATAQAVLQVNNENNVLKAEVVRLRVELHNNEGKHNIDPASPYLPAYEDIEITLGGTDE